MAKGKFPFFGKESKGEESKEKKMGKAAYMRGEKSEGEKFACGGKVKKMADGGRVDPRAAAAIAAMQRRPALSAAPARPELAARAAEAMQRRPAMPAQAKYVPQNPGMKAGGSVKGFAKGGGIELKGKTKGRFI